jgi:hypothetical protein
MSEKHLRLTHDEFLMINDQLTEAELRVYLYLRTLDPFGDRKLTIDTSVISEQLGLVRRTVQKCLKSLESKKLIDWEVVVSKISTRSANVGSPSESRIAKRTQDRLSESRIATANVGSPRRTQDRQQPLEVNQGNDSTTPHPSSSFYNLSQSDRSEDFSNFSNSENSEKLQRLTAIAQIAMPISKPEVEIEALEAPDASNKKRLPDITDIAIEGDSFRRRVEDFVLKEMKFTPRDRTAYFSKFTTQHWQDWEAKYKAQFAPSPVAHKAFIPEVIEVAPHDSEAVRDALAQMRKSLGIKVVK